MVEVEIINNNQHIFPRILFYLFVVIVLINLVALFFLHDISRIKEYKGEIITGKFIIILYSEHCSYCRDEILRMSINPYYDILNKANIKLYKMHIKKFNELYKEKNDKIPLTILYSNGKEINRILGYKSGTMNKMIKEIKQKFADGV